MNLRVTYFISEEKADHRTYVCRAQLLDLPEGTHRLTIVVQAEPGAVTRGYYTVKKSLTFTVNAAAPRVSILSLKPAETYNSTRLPLEFTVSEPTAWLRYSIDGGASVTIAGNTTISGLAEGTHNIVVQAEDSAGSVGESSPVTFTVETQGPGQPGGSQPAIFPTTLIIAIAILVSVVAISLGLLFYLRKRRHRSSDY